MNITKENLKGNGVDWVWTLQFLPMMVITLYALIVGYAKIIAALTNPSVVGTLCIFIIGLTLVVFQLWIASIALKDSALWGILSFFFGVVALLYTLGNWEKCKPPLKILAGGIAISITLMAYLFIFLK